MRIIIILSILVQVAAYEVTFIGNKELIKVATKYLEFL